LRQGGLVGFRLPVTLLWFCQICDCIVDH